MCVMERIRGTSQRRRLKRTTPTFLSRVAVETCGCHDNHEEEEGAPVLRHLHTSLALREREVRLSTGTNWLKLFLKRSLRQGEEVNLVMVSH